MHFHHDRADTILHIITIAIAWLVPAVAAIRAVTQLA
jgi:hypothetical protein